MKGLYNAIVEWEIKFSSCRALYANLNPYAGTGVPRGMLKSLGYHRCCTYFLNAENKLRGVKKLSRIHMRYLIKLSS